MTVQLLPGAGMPESVNLVSLITLDDAGFQDGYMTDRGVDKDTVEHFINADVADWPAIEVALVSVNGVNRYAVVDGRHRWEAAKAKKMTTIRARAKTYASEEEVIETAFRANMKNGRGMSTGERSQYALWLFWQDPSDKPNVSAIARRVGLNQSTVSRAISKELARLEAEEEAEKRGASVQEITETERLLKAIRRYMEQEQAFFSGERGDRSVEKRASSLVRHISTMKDKGKATRAATDIQTLAATLAKIDFTTAGPKRRNA